MCPKCGEKGNYIEMYYGGGKWHACCKMCLWHGLAKSLKSPGIIIAKSQEYVTKTEGDNL